MFLDFSCSPPPAPPEPTDEQLSIYGAYVMWSYILAWQAQNMALMNLCLILRGGSPVNDNAAMLEFLADRLVHVHGENPNSDLIQSARARAARMRDALNAYAKNWEQS